MTTMLLSNMIEIYCIILIAFVKNEMNHKKSKKKMMKTWNMGRAISDYLFREARPLSNLVI